MTKEEYTQWWKVTQASKSRWINDFITAMNGKRYLYYKGGENGTFLTCEEDGTLNLGYYEGAIPHIGEAIFKPQHSRKVGNSRDEALQYVVNRLKLAGLLPPGQ